MSAKDLLHLVTSGIKWSCAASCLLVALALLYLLTSSHSDYPVERCFDGCLYPQQEQRMESDASDRTDDVIKTTTKTNREDEIENCFGESNKGCIQSISLRTAQVQEINLVREHFRQSSSRRVQNTLSAQNVSEKTRFLNTSRNFTLEIGDTAGHDNSTLNGRQRRSSRSGSEGLKRRLPQAIIMGVKKGGTRALLEFLRVHPDVRAAGPETHFFDKHYHNGFDWYRRQMPKTLDGQLTIEKSPSYFVTRDAPSRVHRLSHVIGADVRLILVVRDPVTRAISDYTQVTSKRAGTASFDELAFVRANTTNGLGVDTSWGAIKIGLYAKHLERWLGYFPLRLIHIVNGEKLITDPAGELARLQDFLGLKRLVTEKHFYFNSTKGFPCLKKGETSGRPRCLGSTKGRPHPYVEQSVVERLRQFYRPFNKQFYLLTGIDFGWP